MAIAGRNPHSGGTQRKGVHCCSYTGHPLIQETPWCEANAVFCKVGQPKGP